MTKDNKPIYYPDNSLEAKFEAGDLKDIEVQIHDFVERHHASILSIADTLINNDVKHPYIGATQILVGKRGSIHLPSEMAALIQEINKEKWIRAEEGESDNEVIKDEWSRKYAATWREARKIEILYVIDKRQDEVRSILFEMARKSGIEPRR